MADDSNVIVGFCGTPSVSTVPLTLTAVPENFEFFLNIYFSRWNLGMYRRYWKYAYVSKYAVSVIDVFILYLVISFTIYS